MAISIIQEDYKNDPWKVLVCCILLNQTNNKQVRPLIKDFFDRWPNSFCLMEEQPEVVSNFIKTTGFQNIKAKRLKSFSIEWSMGTRDPHSFPGIGNYGREAWKIFVEKDFNFTPKDKKLKMYLDAL